jgi:hypothetical protein
MPPKVATQSGQKKLANLGPFLTVFVDAHANKIEKAKQAKQGATQLIPVLQDAFVELVQLQDEPTAVVHQLLEAKVPASLANVLVWALPIAFPNGHTAAGERVTNLAFDAWEATMKMHAWLGAQIAKVPAPLAKALLSQLLSGCTEEGEHESCNGACD